MPDDELPHFKEKLFSTTEEQAERAQCNHNWVEKRGYVLEYIRVDWQCTICGTYRADKSRGQIKTAQA